MPEVSDILMNEFGPKGYKPTTMRVPRWAIYLGSFFDPESRSILPQINLKRNIDPINSKNILGIKFNTDAADMVRMMAYGAINAGLIPDKSADKSLSSSYCLPDFDLTGVPAAK